jgi:hypothetical protein
MHSLCNSIVRVVISEELGIDGRIILEWILGKNRLGRCGLDAFESG